MEPSPNGRLTNGRFGIGNSGGPGNPHAHAVAKLRSVLLETVTPEDLKAIIGKLIELAKSGNLAAMKLLLDRAVGKSFVDRLPNVKSPTAEIPRHDANGDPLTLDEKKALILQRIAGLMDRTEQKQAAADKTNTPIGGFVSGGVSQTEQPA